MSERFRVRQPLRLQRIRSGVPQGLVRTRLEWKAPPCHPEHIRCTQGKLREGSSVISLDGYTALACTKCHPERSEGSSAMGNEILHCAQDDTGAGPSCHTHSRPPAP